VNEAAADGNVRVVILTGAGSAFSVGHDRTIPDSDIEKSISLETEDKLLNFGKPLIAAINGYALGGGMQYALLCDIILASDKAVIGFIGPLVGMLCYVAVWALPAVVGWKKASELLLTCDQISAEEAYRIGLVGKVVRQEELIPTALEIAQKITKTAPLSIKYTKEALRRGLFDAGTKKFVQEALRVLVASEDMKEAARAFMEKRNPIFRGR